MKRNKRKMDNASINKDSSLDVGSAPLLMHGTTRPAPFSLLISSNSAYSFQFYLLF